MKKIILIVATWFSLTACTKEATTPGFENETVQNEPNPSSTENVRATVIWTADPASDGFGWVLQTSKDHIEVPKNLPEVFRSNGLEVIVSYKATNERVSCKCSQPIYYVHITSINYANP